MFGLDFCTPRYLISKELGMIKLKVGWGLRARKYEEKISVRSAENLARECMTEKKQYGWKDRYGEKRKKYLNKIGWGKEEEKMTEWNKNDLENEIIGREKNIQRKEKEERIKNARYNTR